MNSSINTVHIVGAGLAGSECALQLASQGFQIKLYEMRPETMTPAHKTEHCGELVCSNSFGSLNHESSAPGQLKWEAEQLKSFILETGKTCSVPAGQALGIDRELFGKALTLKIKNTPNIELITKTINSLDEIPRPCVVATGPLTSLELSQSMQKHFGNDFLYFFDSIAPIIDTDSICTEKTWKADRWGKGTDDYINCPFTEEQYYSFISEIEKAEKIEPKEFEKDTPFFDACMPIEEIVRRGKDTPRFGPMSPKGLPYPGTDKWPFAVVQLRQDNKLATAYNIVGFQTKMSYSEQKRVFRLIPGLEKADFLKLGSIHRNLFINTPKILNDDFSSKHDPLLFFAGQITGVEGYFESTCIGLMLSHIIKHKLNEQKFEMPPISTALGAIINAVTTNIKDNFQPTNINYGLFEPLEKKYPKKIKKIERNKRAKEEFLKWMKLYF